jgi:soluble lytic murein transglycosylase-like protein
MFLSNKARAAVASMALLVVAQQFAYGAEHVTLRNGFTFDCLRREATGNSVRLYLIPAFATAAESTYVEIPSASILRIETVPDPAPAALVPLPAGPSTLDANPLAPTPEPSVAAALTPSEMQKLLARAGEHHNIDADLLAAVVQAESAGQVRAVSRTGARGLMQLMPGTASTLGVRDSFAPEQNIAGGSAYLDQLLTRYRDNIALALAAYNAGPAAVDRYRGIPPYAETRAYVARVIREFNRRKLAANPHLLASAQAALK